MSLKIVSLDNEEEQKQYIIWKYIDKLWKITKWKREELRIYNGNRQGNT